MSDLYESSWVRLLVLSDLDVPSCFMLSEFCVQKLNYFDGIIVLGPFNTPHTYEMSIALAHLENVVCRVIYLPCGLDNTESLLSQVHLTPNSVNIFARKIPLANGLFVTGYSEVSSALVKSNNNEVYDDLCMDYESTTTVENINELLTDSCDMNFVFDEQTVNLYDKWNPPLKKNAVNFGILALTTCFSASLNQILFHSDDLFVNSNTKMILMSHISDTGYDHSTTSRLPKKVGDVDIIGVPSLKKDKAFIAIEFTKDSSGSWSCVNQEKRSI